MTNKYELRSTTIPGSEWVEVTREQWIKAERAAGFRPKMASDDPLYMQTEATGGFSSSGGSEGRIRWDGDSSQAVDALDELLAQPKLEPLTGDTMRPDAPFLGFPQTVNCPTCRLVMERDCLREEAMAARNASGVKVWIKEPADPSGDTTITILGGIRPEHWKRLLALAIEIEDAK